MGHWSGRAARSGRSMSGAGLFRRPPTEPVQLTSGPISWGRPIPGKDGSKIFARGPNPAGRAFPLRREKQTVPALSGGHFRPGCRLLQGRQVGSLRFLPGRDPVEGQPGWKQSRATERPSDAAFLASLVARRQTDLCSRTLVSSDHWSNLHRLRRGRRPAETSPRRSVIPGCFPFWSPDGHRIVFNGIYAGEQETCEFSTSTAARSQPFPDRMA